MNQLSHKATSSDWANVFGFLSHLQGWAVSAADKDLSAYLLSSHVRDLFYDFEAAFALNRIPAPRPEDHPGEAYLEMFQSTVESVGDWVRGAL